MAIFSVEKLTQEARKLALEYRQATGKTLPITAEIAVNDAIRLLELTAAGRDVSAYDAIMHVDGTDIRVQIKGRAIFKDKPGGYRIGQLKLEQDWDAVILVIMNEQFETDEIYFASRDDLQEHLESGAKNRKGSLSIARFKIIGHLIWSSVNGREDDGIWSNQ